MKRIRVKPEIASYIWKLSDDIEVVGLLEVSLGRVLEKAARDGSPVMQLIDIQKASHITDWLTAAVRSGEPWLSNTDVDGRPKKLMKFSDVEGILKEADKAVAKLAQKGRTVLVVDGDEELYAELDDGFHVVRLLTPNALDRDSAAMQHCIGGGAYDHKVGSEDYDYISLRDRFGKPHVTMELDLRSARGPKMIQIYGKQNAAPDAKYALLLGSMFRKRGIRVGQVGSVVFDRDWNAHSLVAMPEKITVRGNMEIRSIDDLVLPSELTVEGDLTIDGCHCITMPKYMRVGGDMLVLLSSIVEQSEELAVGNKLSLVMVKTPAIGVADSMKAQSIRAEQVRTWIELGDIYFSTSSMIIDCGVSDDDLVVAKDRTTAKMLEEMIECRDSENLRSPSARRL